MKRISHIIIDMFLWKLGWLQTPNIGESIVFKLWTRPLTVSRRYDRWCGDCACIARLVQQGAFYDSPIHKQWPNQGQVCISTTN